ncbi:MAG: galactose-1-phosphate uridylyltransferase [Acidimicrobiales bacterium]
MTDVRIDPLSGATVVVVGFRQGRPNLPDGCPFCPGGLEAPEPYEVRWFKNRWPPLPDGRAEILLFSPEHAASLAGLGVAGVRRVVDLWADRTVALGGREDVSYVFPFENRGPEVGATIQHPHGQVYAFDTVPAVPRRELQAPSCVLCDAVADDRIVTRVGGWWAAVPHAPMWPYELLMAPDDHLPDVPTASGAERDGFAAVLVDALTRLDQVFDGPMPYMLWVHQRPTDGGDWPSAHLHVHVAPLLRRPGVPRYVAAAEQGSGVWFDPVVPEDAAATLRSLPGPPA